MLTPVPGYTHLKVLIPDPEPTPPTPPPPDAGGRRTAARLIQVALEATFGMRPVRQLTRQLFDAPVRVHVTARRRERSGQAPAPVRLMSLHTRADGEAFGTAVAAGHTHAFVARVTEGRLGSFRVM